jgi:hypothetical protein
VIGAIQTDFLEMRLLFELGKLTMRLGAGALAVKLRLEGVVLFVMLVVVSWQAAAVTVEMMLWL